ncbi:MAG: TonB-dependent receptor [Steroidobacteraceae bacterium]|nr:TonB-dependent receptor [Steroidobacteraceae bacterium]
MKWPTGLALLSASIASCLGTSAGAASFSSSGRLGKVTVVAKRLKRGEGLSHRQVFNSAETVTTIDRAQIRAAGPLAGGAQLASEAPGVNAYGYGGVSGTARYEIVARGIKVGWSSVNGDVERNGLTVLMDGVPMMNMSAHNGGWDSNEIPISALIQNVNVIYGTGNPLTRWYDSLGATINYIPVQPTPRAGGHVGVMYGSNSSYEENAVLRTGVHDGWTGVFGLGYQDNNTFRTGTFKAPSHASAFYGKITKLIDSGSFSVGAYVNRATEYRPNFIPLNPIAGINTDGVNGTGPIYSQPTTGYYSSLDKSVWFKRLKVNSQIIYGKLLFNLDTNVTLHDTLWYRHGYREHYRITNYVPNNNNNSEFYNPYSDTYGDRTYIQWALPHNLVSFGGWIASETYNTVYAGYNTAMGTTPLAPLYYNSDYIYSTFLNGFVQDHVTLGSKFAVTPGIAMVQYQTRTFNNGAAEFPNAPATATNQTSTPNVFKRFTKLETSIDARFQVNHTMAVYGNYSITYQNPTDNAFGAYVTSPIDLSSLKAIRSNDGEVGVKFLFPHFGILRQAALNADVFQTTISDETISTYLTNINLIKFATASAKIQGATVEASARPGFNWHVYANLTYLRSTYQSFIPGGSSTNYGGYPISNSPKISATFGGVYRFHLAGLSYRLTAQDQYVGSRYLFSNNLGAPTYQTMPSYNVVNATLQSTIGLGDEGSLSLTAGVDNVLDTQYDPTAYITSGGYFGGNSTNAILVDPGAPRQFYVAATWNF